MTSREEFNNWGDHPDDGTAEIEDLADNQAVLKQYRDERIRDIAKESKHRNDLAEVISTTLEICKTKLAAINSNPENLLVTDKIAIIAFTKVLSFALTEDSMLDVITGDSTPKIIGVTGLDLDLI